AVAAGRCPGRLHSRTEGTHRQAEHAPRPRHRHQRGRGEEASIPAGGRPARVLCGWKRGGLVMPKQLHGVLAIAHTPFTESDEIDAAALKRSVDWAFAVGADGIGTGMVSETLKLTHDERLTLPRMLVE